MRRQLHYSHRRNLHHERGVDFWRILVRLPTRLLLRIFGWVFEPLVALFDEFCDLPSVFDGVIDLFNVSGPESEHDFLDFLPSAVFHFGLEFGDVGFDFLEVFDDDLLVLNRGNEHFFPLFRDLLILADFVDGRRKFIVNFFNDFVPLPIPPLDEVEALLVPPSELLVLEHHLVLRIRLQL